MVGNVWEHTLSAYVMQVLQAQPALSSTLSRSSNSRSTPHSFSSSHSNDSFVPVTSTPHSSQSTQAAGKQAEASQPSCAASPSSQTEQAGAATTTQPDLSDPFQQSVDALHAEETVAPSQHQQAALDQVASQLQQISLHKEATRDQDTATQSVPDQQSSAGLAGSSQLPLQEGRALTHFAATIPPSAFADVGNTEAAPNSPLGSASTDAWEMVQVGATTCLDNFELS